MANKEQEILHLPKQEAPPSTEPAKNDLVSVAPTPELNPRNQILKEIAERANADADNDAKETVQQLDEDGNPVETQSVHEPVTLDEPIEPAVDENVSTVATETTTPHEQDFDPDKDYDLVVNGKPMRVKGAQIIERGKMAIQKETAADQKLELASNLLQEVQAKLAAQPPAQGVVQQPSPNVVTDEQLAEIIQYGTKEQAAQAIGMLRSASQSPDAIAQLTANLPKAISDQLAFHEGAKFAQDEYGDLLADPYLQQMFFMRENHLRQTGGVDGRGDTRPYKELYKEIGDDLRSHFNRPKTTPATITEAPKTREEKVAAKAAAPAAPKLASARMEAAAEKKPPTREEIIAKMQAARGQRAA